MITILAIWIPLGLTAAIVEFIMSLPERRRDRRAVAYLRKRRIRTYRQWYD